VRRALCVAEWAVSFVLLVSATLLGRSLVRLMNTDLGVSADHVVTASLNLALGRRLADVETLERVQRVIERIEGIPGLHAVGVGTALPPATSRMGVTLRLKRDAVDYAAAAVPVSPGYFSALRMRLLQGRFFTDTDDAEHPHVMIMSEDTARRFFGTGETIGRTMSLPLLKDGRGTAVDMTLVGVIANVKYAGLAAAPEDVVYRPFAQQTWVAPFLVARTHGDPSSLVSTIRREIAGVDRGIVVSAEKTFDAILADATAQPRFQAVLLASFTALALAMAAVGLYGVVAFSVTQRTAEIGIRMALGARPLQVLAMVIREGISVGAMGLVAGLVGALALGRLLTTFLYGIAPTDPVSFGTAAAALLAVALIASYLPARRAMRVDPLVALRCE